MKQIEEGLLEVLSNDVELKRKSLTGALALLVVGVCIVIASSQLSGYASSTAVFIGGLVGLVGLLMCLTSFFNKEYFYIPEKSRLQKKVEFYDLAEETTAKRLVESGKFEDLSGLRKSTAPTLQVISYRTKSGKVIAAQLQKYIPYAYHPMTDIIINR